MLRIVDGDCYFFHLRNYLIDDDGIEFTFVEADATLNTLIVENGMHLTLVAIDCFYRTVSETNRATCTFISNNYIVNQFFTLMRVAGMLFYMCFVFVVKLVQGR